MILLLWLRKGAQQGLASLCKTGKSKTRHDREYVNGCYGEIKSVLDQVSIVLVSTSHPGNIGAVARAMKNMGLKRLILVRPKEFPHAECTARSAGADDVLEEAKVVQSLREAVAMSHFVVGTSARQRTVPWPLSNPRQCVEKINPLLNSGQKIAFVFGNEQSGLSNEELSLCHYHLHIPCTENFSSLNVAAAVQIVTYELRMMIEQSTSLAPNQPKYESRLATTEEVEQFYDRLEELLIRTGYLNLGNPKKLMLRLRRLFNRAHLEDNEIQILRGILASINFQLSKEG